MMWLDRPRLGELEKKKLKGKAGAPWKHATREEEAGSVPLAYRDIRVEERFFLGNLTRNMGLRERKGEGMRQYRPTGAERERGYAPDAFSTMENEYGRVELGTDKKKEFLTVTVAQKVDADRRTLPGVAKKVDGAGATPVRGTVGEKGKTLINNRNPRQSALAFRSQMKRGYRDALSLMLEIKRRGGSEAIEEALPFLSHEEEREEEGRLSEQMRGAQTNEERQALSLRLGHIQRVRRLKDQRKKEFIQNMDIAIRREKNRHGAGGGHSLRERGFLRRIRDAIQDGVREETSNEEVPQDEQE